MAEMENRWLSADEIGKHLGVSSKDGYRWIDKLTIPTIAWVVFWSSRKTRLTSGRLAVR